MRFVIPIPPVTKKNSQRIFVRNGRPFIAPSAAFTRYQSAALWYLKPKTMIDYPVCVRCEFYMPTKRRVDLVNLLEAADDVLVKAGILADDNASIIVSHDGSRVLHDPDNPRTEIEITEA